MTNRNRNHEENRGPVESGPSLHGDKTLGKLAENTNAPSPARNAAGPGHDEGEIRKHNDTGRDRLFEDRQQHDEAEKNSEKTRHARDVDRHQHGEQSELADRDNQSRSKRKN